MVLTVEGYRKKSSWYGLRKLGIFKLKQCFCHGIAYCCFQTEEFLFWLHPKSLNPIVLFVVFCWLVFGFFGFVLLGFFFFWRGMLGRLCQLSSLGMHFLYIGLFDQASI